METSGKRKGRGEKNGKVGRKYLPRKGEGKRKGARKKGEA